MALTVTKVTIVSVVPLTEDLLLQRTTWVSDALRASIAQWALELPRESIVLKVHTAVPSVLLNRLSASLALMATSVQLTECLKLISHFVNKVNTAELVSMKSVLTH